MLTTMTPDEPRSPDAQPAQATPQAHGADTRRGRRHVHPSLSAPTSRSSSSPRATARRCAGSTSSARVRPTARGSRSTSTSTRSTTRTSISRNQRPKVDEYDDYLFVVLHFPAYDKTVGRLNAAELDVFVGPDYVITLPNEPIQPLEYLFERCRTRDDLREQLFSKGPGYLLYKIVDDCVDASFPMLRKMGNKLERLEDDIFEGRSSEIVRDISNVKQEIINFRRVVRPQRAALKDLEATSSPSSGIRS